MSDLKYAIVKEDEDTRHLIHFNDHVHFFTELNPTPHWCRYDYTATDKYGRKVLIEHKSRSPYYNLDYFQEHPIYIETEKYHYTQACQVKQYNPTGLIFRFIRQKAVFP